MAVKRFTKRQSKSKRVSKYTKMGGGLKDPGGTPKSNRSHGNIVTDRIERLQTRANTLKAQAESKHKYNPMRYYLERQIKKTTKKYEKLKPIEALLNKNRKVHTLQLEASKMLSINL